MRPGTIVRMSEDLKRRLRGPCGPAGRHVGLPDGVADPEMPDDGCLRCSSSHVEEFGSCEGTVEDRMTGPTGEPWPEWNVRWAPSGLRYGYHPSELEIVL